MSHKKTKNSHLNHQRDQPKLSIVEQALSADYIVDCDNFECVVNDVMDRRESPGRDPLLASHASECPDCKVILADYMAVDDSLKLSKEEIALLMSQPQKPSSGGYRNWSWIGFVSAAVAFLCCSFWWMDRQSGSEHQAAIRLSQLSAAHTVATTPVPEQAVEEEASSSTNFLPVESATRTLAQMKFEWPIDLAYDPHSYGIDGSIDLLAEQLRPMIQYSTDIPGVVPGPVNMTLELLRSISEPPAKEPSKSKPEKGPDLGGWTNPAYQFASV